jgi:hypothetical protein
MGLCLHGGPTGEPGRGGSLPRVFERRVQECSGHAVSLSTGALRGEPWGGGGAPYGAVRKRNRRPG